MDGSGTQLGGVSLRGFKSRAIAASAMGNAIEWYDYGIYAYLIASVGDNFFPGTNETAKTLSAFALFAVPFVVRPFGSSPRR